MAYNKCECKDNETVITAQMMNDIQDAICGAEQDIHDLKGGQQTLEEHVANKNNPHGVTAEQIGARPNTWTPTASDVGARPDTWVPTAEQVGARPSNWMPSHADMGIPNLSTYRMTIPANGRVRFTVAAQMLMFGGVQAVNHKPAIYAFHAYATIRQPYVHELSAGHLITVATGGNNTDGWYVEITSASSGSNVVLYFIGNTIPGIIA